MINKITNKWINTLKKVNDTFIVPDWERFRDSIDFTGYEFKFGNGTTFGNGTIFGNYTTFGNGTIFGNNTKFGDGTTFGRNIEWNKTITNHIYKLANIDGSGRQVLIAKCNKNELIRIEAGCFKGTSEEFINRANHENKLMYVQLVGAFCDGLKQKKGGCK